MKKKSQNSPWNIIKRKDDDDFVAYSVSLREIWGRRESVIVVPDDENRPGSQNVGSLASQPLDAAAGHINIYCLR